MLSMSGPSYHGEFSSNVFFQRTVLLSCVCPVLTAAAVSVVSELHLLALLITQPRALAMGLNFIIVYSVGFHWVNSVNTLGVEILQPQCLGHVTQALTP